MLGHFLTDDNIIGLILRLASGFYDFLELFDDCVVGKVDFQVDFLGSLKLQFNVLFDFIEVWLLHSLLLFVSIFGLFDCFFKPIPSPHHWVVGF